MTADARPSEADAAAALRAAVLAWLDGLDAARRAAASFPFASDERFVWDYRPGPRRGLAIAAMTPAERALAWRVVDVAMSGRGAAEIRSIVALEPILGDLERRAGRGDWERRDPERYWFAVFGDPTGDGPWSWRLGGHHVAVQATVVGGRIVRAAPSFLGANPATIPDGPQAGERAIDGEERLARALLASLTPAERAQAIVDPVAPPDILSGNGRRADIRDIATGIRHDGLAIGGQGGLEALIRHYLGRVHAGTADAAWARVMADGLGEVTFAWAGPDAPGRGHYYAVRGPAFLLEYDNTQNGANHIHAVWRDLADDWGEDALAAHYRAGHRDTG
jgi:Protein of unknown function (DUF3500)